MYRFYVIKCLVAQLPKVVSRRVLTTGVWTQLTNAGQRDWRSICSDQTGQFLSAVAFDKFIYTSSNYGTNWTVHGTSDLITWTDITSDLIGQNLVAVADSAEVGVHKQ